MVEDRLYTQSEVAACTSADMKTIDNYVQHDHARPLRREGGRRLFSFNQMLQIEFTARLASVCKLPPKLGSKLARQMMVRNEFGLDVDIRTVDQGSSWPRQASKRPSLIFDPSDKDEVDIKTPGRIDQPDHIHLVFPAQHFSRLVLQKAAAIAAAAAERGETIEDFVDQPEVVHS